MNPEEILVASINDGCSVQDSLALALHAAVKVGDLQRMTAYGSALAGLSLYARPRREEEEKDEVVIGGKPEVLSGDPEKVKKVLGIF